MIRLILALVLLASLSASAAAPQDAVSSDSVRRQIEQDHYHHPKRVYFTWLSQLNFLHRSGQQTKIGKRSEGIFQILNSLAWQNNLVELQFLSDDRAIAVVDWHKFRRLRGSEDRPEVWARVLDRCRSFPGLPAADFDCTMRLLKLEPQLYYEWLGLPDTEAELLEILGIDLHEQVRTTLQQDGSGKLPAVLRVAAQADETFAPLPRFFSRYAIDGKHYYWRSLEIVEQGRDESSFFKRPLVEEAPDTFPELGFVHDFTETVFSLPNGLQAYIITDALGRIIPEAPAQIMKEDGRSVEKRGLKAGFNCAGCHWSGIVDPKISRPDRNKDSAFNRYWITHGTQGFDLETTAVKPDLLKILTILFPNPAQVSTQVEKDQDVFAKALQRAAGQSSQPVDNGILDWL